MAFLKKIVRAISNIVSNKPKVSSAVVTKTDVIKTRNHGDVKLPAQGRFVCESHYAVYEVTYNGRNFPGSKDQNIVSHLNDSIKALKKWFPEVKLEDIYKNSWERQWTPANDGTINEWGQGSRGQVKPFIEEEIWQGNMYFARGCQPKAHERFLITNPKNGKKCVIQMAYEMGPGSTSFLGGLVPEVHWYLGSNNDSKLQIDRIADHTPLGPMQELVVHEPVKNEPPVNHNGSFTTPEFVEVEGVKFDKQGNYQTKSKMFDGLVVHYTVSGNLASSAKGVLGWLDKEGYGCMVMDLDGKIYIPKGWDILKEWDDHAGKSKWGNRESVSRYFAGMEICCWGLNSKVGPFREVKASQGYIVSGKYQAFTEAQEKSLTNFILWAKSKNPDFSIDNVVGHDELRKEFGKPGDKQDPGGSLSMTMPQYRDYLRKLVGT